MVLHIDEVGVILYAYSRFLRRKEIEVMLSKKGARIVIIIGIVFISESFRQLIDYSLIRVILGERPPWSVLIDLSFFGLGVWLTYSGLVRLTGGDDK